MEIEPEETVDEERRVAFRCSCGADVLLPIGGNGVCDTCHKTIRLGRLDPSQTISFCSEIGSCTEFQLSNGPDRSGESLGHFRLLSKLGYGGMGAVYRALDESLQRFVAVKVIRSADTHTEVGQKLVQRLLDEAVAQARLNHPNVVTIYYVGRDGEEPFFAMELLPGPTLAQKIIDEPLPYEEVIRYARQVCSALAQANRLGLVHGDIKPSNLVLANDQTVKLSDFGLARTDRSVPTGGISGTLSYLAPELSSGGQPTIQSDMYSLGVTLFELAFGRRPYAVTGTTLQEQLTSTNEAEVQFPERWPESIPERFRDLLGALMARHPEDRFQDFEKLDQSLKGIAPIGFTRASLMVRMMAFVIDYLLLTLGMIPFLIGQELMDQGIISQSSRYFAPLIMLFPLAAILSEKGGKRTLGRYLLQLRIVDQHGLLLDGRRRMLRSIVRYGPAMLMASSVVLTAFRFQFLSVLIFPLFLMWLLADILPALATSHLALHDRLCGSRNVLDTVSD
ncbi:MAG: protein kinase [Planctomycetota bacterium]|nr:protein kinase [Planctomycetota bacterium]